MLLPEQDQIMNQIGIHQFSTTSMQLQNTKHSFFSMYWIFLVAGACVAGWYTTHTHTHIYYY